MDSEIEFGWGGAEDADGLRTNTPTPTRTWSGSVEWGGWIGVGDSVRDSWLGGCWDEGRGDIVAWALWLSLRFCLWSFGEDGEGLTKLMMWR